MEPEPGLLIETADQFLELMRHIDSPAVGLNFVDIYYRSGLYPVPLPAGLGGEGAGVVLEIGSGVTGLKPGDRVAYGAAPLGAYAEERVPYAIARYTNEVKRLTRVLNHRLDEVRWLAGDEYSMADIITFPWIRTAVQTGARFAARGSIDLADYPAVKRWHDEMGARPAVQRGLAVLADQQRDQQISETERENMFGATQFAVR